MVATVDEARALFDQRMWGPAYRALSALERDPGLTVQDLERLAVAAYLVGEEGHSIQVWTRAHSESLGQAEHVRAAQCAFWLGFVLVTKGEMARAAGWFARAERLLDGQQECVERGYLMVMGAVPAMVDGDAKAALHTFEQALEIGERFGETDLITLARLSRGQAMLELGQLQAGVGCLDEAMVAVTAGEVSPLVAGLVYCAVIASCHAAFDLARAQEWTVALTQWCDAQPDLVPYRGQCTVHRAELMRVHGAWDDAVAEADRACARLDGEPAVGDAYYERAELHRLVGEFSQAEEAYRRANRWGRSPQPGLALLRLAQGRIDAAHAAIRSVALDVHRPADRPRVLAASIEIALAGGDVDAARTAVGELEELADETDAPLLEALAAHARGALDLADGNAEAAYGSLRRAWRGWQRLNAPYEAAQTRVLLALACQALGDHDTADMELDAARWGFEFLGAAPDLARLHLLAAPDAAAANHGLSEREIQVLRLVAAGNSNRDIATALVISEKTVARHVSNIFAKLGVSSRAAATGYAYEHGLV